MTTTRTTSVAMGNDCFAVSETEDERHAGMAATATAAAAALGAGEAEALVVALAAPSMREMGSSKWMRHHEHCERLNIQVRRGTRLGETLRR